MQNQQKRRSEGHVRMGAQFAPVAAFARARGISYGEALRHMRNHPELKIFTQYYPGAPFRLPGERQQLFAQFWPLRKVAREYKITYRQALQYLCSHPELAVWVRTRRADGRLQWGLCLNLNELRWAEA